MSPEQTVLIVSEGQPLWVYVTTAVTAVAAVAVAWWRRK